MKKSAGLPSGFRVSFDAIAIRRALMSSGVAFGSSGCISAAAPQTTNPARTGDLQQVLLLPTERVRREAANHPVPTGHVRRETVNHPERYFRFTTQSRHRLAHCLHRAKARRDFRSGWQWKTPANHIAGAIPDDLSHRQQKKIAELGLPGHGQSPTCMMFRFRSPHSTVSPQSTESPQSTVSPQRTLSACTPLLSHGTLSPQSTVSPHSTVLLKSG